MKWILIIPLFLASFQLVAQGEVSGYWEGELTQDEGGYRSSYKFEMFIIQQGDKITGRSYVFVDDIYAQMEIKGNLHSGLLLMITDMNIIDDKISEGMEWCLKTYQLVRKVKAQQLILEGRWQGKTSFSSCIPGKITLRKVEPRA